MDYLGIVFSALAIICFLASIACQWLMIAAARRVRRGSLTEAMREVHRAHGAGFGPRIRVLYRLWLGSLVAGFAALLLGTVVFSN